MVQNKLKCEHGHKTTICQRLKTTSTSECTHFFVLKVGVQKKLISGFHSRNALRVHLLTVDFPNSLLIDVRSPIHKNTNDSIENPNAAKNTRSDSELH